MDASTAPDRKKSGTYGEVTLKGNTATKRFTMKDDDYWTQCFTDVYFALCLQKCPGVVHLQDLTWEKDGNPCTLTYPRHEIAWKGYSSEVISSDLELLDDVHELLGILQMLHECGFAHGDVSYGNLLRLPPTEEGKLGSLILCDFGAMMDVKEQYKYKDGLLGPSCNWATASPETFRQPGKCEFWIPDPCKLDVWSAVVSCLVICKKVKYGEFCRRTLPIEVDQWRERQCRSKNQTIALLAQKLLVMDYQKRPTAAEARTIIEEYALLLGHKLRSELVPQAPEIAPVKPTSEVSAILSSELSAFSTKGCTESSFKVSRRDSESPTQQNEQTSPAPLQTPSQEKVQKKWLPTWVLEQHGGEIPPRLYKILTDSLSLGVTATEAQAFAYWYVDHKFANMDQLRLGQSWLRKMAPHLPL